MKEHEHVIPVIYREPAAPSKLMDVISCSGKACSGRCSCGSRGLSCTSYCVCEGGMIVVPTDSTGGGRRRHTTVWHCEVDYDDLAGEDG